MYIVTEHFSNIYIYIYIFPVLLQGELVCSDGVPEAVVLLCQPGIYIGVRCCANVLGGL